MSATDSLHSINSTLSVVQKLVQSAWTKLSQQNPGHFKGYRQKPQNPINIHKFLTKIRKTSNSAKY